MSVDADGTFWDDMYRSRTALWSGEPNLQLVADVSALAPGRALDAGCGEGADAIWLAERGWRVTAADVSAVALGRAQAVAISTEVAQRIEWIQANLATWVPPARTYDLVTAQYVHLPDPPREKVFRALADAVKPHGSLLIVGHHPSDLQTTASRPPLPELFYTADDVAAFLTPEDWEIVVNAAREKTATDRAGRTVVVHDTVLHARRRG